MRPARFVTPSFRSMDRRNAGDDLRGRPRPVRVRLEAEKANVGTLTDCRSDGRVGILGLAALSVALESETDPRPRRTPLSSDQDACRGLRDCSAHRRTEERTPDIASEALPDP